MKSLVVHRRHKERQFFVFKRTIVLWSWSSQGSVKSINIRAQRWEFLDEQKWRRVQFYKVLFIRVSGVSGDNCLRNLAVFRSDSPCMTSWHYIFFCNFTLVITIFDQYQKARLLFVQSVSDFATKPSNVACLEAAGALDLLRPLLTDAVPSIQHMAAIALGKIANHDHRLAEALIRKDILPQLLKNIDKQNVWINFTRKQPSS